MKLKHLGIYFDLFKIFFKIGAFTFGGGWAMISIIEREVVDKRKWLTKEDFLDALAVSQSMPGILAVNLSIYVGQKLKSFKGALVATLGTVLPSFFIILVVAIFFTQINTNPQVQAVFYGMRPAVVALIISPVLSTGKAAQINRYNAWLPVSCTLLIWLLGVSPVYIILGVAVYSLGKLYLKSSH